MSKLVSGLLIGGGLAALGALLLAKRESDATVRELKDALTKPPLLPPPPGQPDGAGSTVNVHTTGYWPFTARADERKMEGGVFDRKMPAAYKNQPDSPQYKAHVLHTLEQHLKDPINHPFVSVSGDDAIWPYGQRVSISAWPKAVFRVVDTGSHFRGLGKVFRVVGEEPLDIAVDSSKTFVPKSGVTATIFPGDNFEGGRAVAATKFKDQRGT